MTPATPARPAALLALALAFALASEQISPAASPKVPDGFKIRLVAAVPAVQYPCQIATSPDGGLFVAEDPMDQIGPYEADNGRILLFREGKEPVVFAEGFRAIFGMAWRDGALYVMHMPRLTVLRDVDGDGKADEQKDLFKDLGPGPKSLNDHIVSGLQFGMDGYLYISVGDKGVPSATGPDGRKITLMGGGTLRCRPDGTEMEVISSGTRNHLEPNLDDRDNLFTYDNTDDGDGWWTRITYHIDGGYYGYPFDYHNRQDRMINRLSEYGGGSPCGGVVYREDVWPEAYRGRALWAEWGKRHVAGVAFEPAGASFKVADYMKFVDTGDAGDFHPIDLALSHDGRTLYVADWGMGGWQNKTEKVGRVFAVTYDGEVKTRPRGGNSDPLDQQIRQLDHPSYNERIRAQLAIIKQGRSALSALTRALADEKTPAVAKRHLLWAIDGIAGATPEASMPILDALGSPIADVRAQAARALGLRRVPIAVDPLVEKINDSDPTVRLQVIIALGRIGDPNAVASLIPATADSDAYLAFSARQALRRINDWKAASSGLYSADARIRSSLMLALEQIYEIDAVTLLKNFIDDAGRDVSERAKAVSYLGQAHHKPIPWNGAWWGTRPSRGKPLAKTTAWEGTKLVLEALRSRVNDPEPLIRVAAIEAIREANDREALPKLRERFLVEKTDSARIAIASTLAGLNDGEALPLLISALRDASTSLPVRDAALSGIETIGGPSAVAALVDLLKARDLSSDRLVRAASALGRFKAKSAVNSLIDLLGNPDASVRSAAATALGSIGVSQGVSPKLRPMLKDKSADVRRAVATAIGALRDGDAVPDLIAAGDDPEIRFEASLALANVPDVRALQVYLRGLSDRNPDLRKASSTALGAIRDQAAPVLERLANRRELPTSSLPELRKIFGSLQPIKTWSTVGPFKISERPPFPPANPVDLAKVVPGSDGKPLKWRTSNAIDPQGQINLGQIYTTEDDKCAFAYAELTSATARTARMSVGSDDTLQVWINGKPAYRFNERRGFSPEQDSVDVPLIQGVNRILIKCGNRGGGWQFSAAFSNASDLPFLKGPSPGAFDPETFRDFAIKTPGKADRGKTLFADVKGVACAKCHAVSGQGGAVGPDLTGIATKYAKEELIASVLFPSAKISSGYEPVTVAVSDGRVLTGIVKSDAADALEILDAEAKRVRIPKADIDDRKPSDVSLMPNGLAEGLTAQDFADLIAYLETLKEKAK